MGSVINLLPLIPMPEAVPPVSTNVSVPVTEDFSALLTELMAVMQVEQPAVQINEPVDVIPAMPTIQVETPLVRREVEVESVVEPETEPEIEDEIEVETVVEAEPETETELCIRNDSEALIERPYSPELEAVGAVYDCPALCVQSPEIELEVEPETLEAVDLPIPAVISDDGATQPVPQETEKTNQQRAENIASPDPVRLQIPLMTEVLRQRPAAADAVTPPAATAPTEQTLPEQLLEDVKKIEITVQREAVSLLHQLPQQRPSIDVELPRPAVITTDPIANLQQRQLPPRIMPIEKIAIAAQVAERRKPDVSEPAVEGRTSAPAPHFPNPFQAAESAEAPRPAQLVEIPEMPRLQVVRTVSMEVGEADSQVIIRVEERDGGVKLHLGARNETMHRNIESSVASLVHALKQEQIQVSNVEVTRKSPIEKVRRMREAQ